MNRLNEHLPTLTPQNIKPPCFTALENMVAWPYSLQRSGTKPVPFDAAPQKSKTLIDQSAFERFYKRYRPMVFTFFARQYFSTEDAHDLTQDVFLRAFSYRRRFKGDNEAALRGWLQKIVESVWKNRLRSGGTLKRAGTTTSLETTPDSKMESNREDNPLQELLTEQRIEPLRKAIGTLPEPMRECLILRVYHQCAYTEIAGILNVTLPMVKNMLHQAKLRIKSQIEKVSTRDAEE